MTHIVLLLYLISGISGISSIIFLIMKYGHTNPYMRGYIKVHLSYTSLMLVALIVLYLRVNVIKSPILMTVFISTILLGMGILTWSLSRLSFIINPSGITEKMKLFWSICPFAFALLSIAQFVLWNSSFNMIPVIMGVSIFIFISIWFSRRNSRVEGHKFNNENRLWIFFLIFTLIVILLELFLKFKWGFMGEYSLNIPVIFLCWNYLSLRQFNKESNLEGSSTEISIESASQWQLTSREVEIANAIIRGDSNKEIASDLNITFSTVKNHIYNIYRKTGAKSRVDLVNIFK